MGTDILVIDYSIDGFKRYASGICKLVKEISSETKIAACYIKSAKMADIPGFDAVFCASEYKLNASDILDDYKPKAILLFGFGFKVSSRK